MTPITFMSYEVIAHIGPLELNRAVPGGRIEMFAIEDHEYLGDWFYRFRYIETGEIQRHDNAHEDDDLGRHHRHVRFGEDSEISFQNVTAHAIRFLQEVAHITDVEDTDND